VKKLQRRHVTSLISFPLHHHLTYLFFQNTQDAGAMACGCLIAACCKADEVSKARTVFEACETNTIPLEKEVLVDFVTLLIANVKSKHEESYNDRNLLLRVLRQMRERAIELPPRLADEVETSSWHTTYTQKQHLNHHHLNHT